MVTSVSGSVPGLIATCSTTFRTVNNATQTSSTPGCAAAPDLRLGEGFPTELPPPSIKPSTFLTPPLLLYPDGPPLVMFDPNLK
ncbi:hypothetical protein WAJ73_22335, partial [Acinetobacter baumannii]